MVTTISNKMVAQDVLIVLLSDVLVHPEKSVHSNIDWCKHCDRLAATQMLKQIVLRELSVEESQSSVARNDVVESSLRRSEESLDSVNDAIDGKIVGFLDDAVLDSQSLK